MNSKTAKKAFFMLLRAKSTYLILSCFVLVSLLSFYLFIRENPREILTEKNKLEAQFFGDKIDGGNSEVLDKQISDSSISIKYILRKGFVNPYAGITLSSFDNNHDFSKFNRIKLNVEGKNIDNIYFHVITQDEAVKNTNHRLAQRLSEINLTLSKDNFNTPISLNLFETPSWWYQTIKQPQSDFKEIAWDKVLKISIITGIPPTLDQVQELQIRSIVFFTDYSFYYLFCGVLISLIVLCLYVYHFVSSKESNQSSIVIEYQAILDDSNSIGKEVNNIFEYIHKNYFDPELSLSKIAQITGLQERIISKHISDKYSCNFRTYVNNLRIAEAERLLRTTDLSISEVAYKVGFNDPSFFSKTFKKITGKTPSSVE